MTTEKENLIFYLSILTLLGIVVCSMLVNFNICDGLYILFTVITIIRYTYLSRKNQEIIQENGIIFLWGDYNVY